MALHRHKILMRHKICMLQMMDLAELYPAGMVDHHQTRSIRMTNTRTTTSNFHLPTDSIRMNRQDLSLDGNTPTVLSAQQAKSTQPTTFSLKELLVVRQGDPAGHRDLPRLH